MRSAALVFVAALAIVVAACVQGSPAPPTSVATPAASPSLAGPSAPAADGSAAASPTAGARPPDASLAAEGGDPVVGQLGTFMWGDGGSDSPWLPGAPITVGAGEPLTVALADRTAIAGWTAVRAPAASTGGVGAVAAGEGSGAIGLAIVERGRWTVAVTMQFAGGGSATWYWQLDVT